jgi:hypothetical protein
LGQPTLRGSGGRVEFKCAGGGHALEHRAVRPAVGEVRIAVIVADEDVRKAKGFAIEDGFADGFEFDEGVLLHLLDVLVGHGNVVGERDDLGVAVRCADQARAGFLGSDAHRKTLLIRPRE